MIANPINQATERSSAMNHNYPDSHLHGDDLLGNLHEGSFLNTVCETEWQVCLERASAETCIPFLGIHPWFLANAENGWQGRLRTLAESRSIGIGEIGIDRFRGPSLDEQIAAFDDQMTIAMECRRPVSIHCVKRWGSVIDVLTDHAPFAANVMVHGFSGPTEIQDLLLNLGCYLSFGFALLDGNEAVVDAWKRMPDDRLLLESDAPPSLEKRVKKVADYGTEMCRLLDAASSLRGLDTLSLAETLRFNSTAFLGR